MNPSKYKITKIACYSTYYTTASIFCLPPLLFVTFHEMYGVSWTLLGTLVLTNFLTQITIDLVFTFFAKKINVGLMARLSPLITSLGLFVFATVPLLFPSYAYLGLLTGTIIFSVASGLSEVILSPTIAAIPSDNPKRDMGILHSLYAFGVFSVVVISTLFILLFGEENWAYLTMFFALLPIISSVLFSLSPMPDMSSKDTPLTPVKSRRRRWGIALCFACIFLGSCAESVMSSWISSFMETEMHVDKALGDTLGVAVFAILLGITRVCYAKWGKSITGTLLIGMIGCAVCYFIAGAVTLKVPAFIACVLVGVFSSMLWPGTLIMMEEKIDGVGVAAFALMASGGDLGASVAPQLMGIVADGYGLRAGMIITAIFPLIGVFLMLVIIRFFKKQTSTENKN